MFEKEAENYQQEVIANKDYPHSISVDWQRGAEFGYNKGLAVGSTFNKALNSLNKTLEVERDKYRNMVFDKDNQLTKAKDLLAKWVELFKPKGGNIPLTPIQEQTEQFLSEVEK